MCSNSSQGRAPAGGSRSLLFRHREGRYPDRHGDRGAAIFFLLPFPEGLAPASSHRAPKKLQPRRCALPVLAPQHRPHYALSEEPAPVRKRLLGAWGERAVALGLWSPRLLSCGPSASIPPRPNTTTQLCMLVSFDCPSEVAFGPRVQFPPLFQIGSYETSQFSHSLDLGEAAKEACTLSRARKLPISHSDFLRNPFL